MSERLAIARAAYADVSLYDPQRVPTPCDLSDNTNLWGAPPVAERTLRELGAASITRYPSLYADTLKRALADYVGVSADMVVTGCGSDDILDSALRAFGEPGDVVAGSDPSFPIVPIFARMNALTWQPITQLPTGLPDIDALLAARARIVYLCTPNNPTGALIPRDQLERVIAHATGVVLVDEAYAEFANVSCVDLIAASDRVLVVRTLSKAFGLAGLRIGYAIGNPALVREVEKSRGPYKVNAIAEHVAVAALQYDREWISTHVALASEIRERLANRLRSMGLSPLPSAANFVLVPVPQALRLAQALRARGVAVRPFASLPLIGDALRITVGPWFMVEQLLTALAESLAESIDKVDP